MHNFLGHDGFVWWIGQVVSIDDPMTLGRCRVRIFGYHGEAKDIPDEDLPWAVSIHPVNTPNLYGTPRVGDFVFGFFLDALAAQEPAMMGYFPYSPPTGTKSFSSVTQKDSVVLDVNGAKIVIDSSGNITISAKGTLILSDSSTTVTLSQLSTGGSSSGESSGSSTPTVDYSVPIQQAFNQANSAFDQANTATTLATDNQSAISIVYASSNTAYDQANSAYNTANIAYTTANGAYVQANVAYATANDAYDKANSAFATGFIVNGG